MSLSLGFDDEEGEFGPGGNVGGSKLSSLFGMDKASNQGGNESLTFTAPKQPKKSGKSTDTSVGGNKSALLLAVAVHAYRFSNGTYIKHGKLGAAILGNHSSNDYKILLYISKMQQVTHALVSPQFLFTTQANNYATFYDEQRRNWSIMFESEQNAIDFAKQVALAKLNSGSGVTTSIIQQDLILGKGDAVVTGDSVEVKYTGWLYQSKMFGDVFDSNANVDKPFRFKIGKGKVIKGWEEGVTGMKKGGRRLLVIPPSHAYGKKGLGTRIPPNSILIFDVEVKKIKLSRDTDGGMSSDAAEMTKSSDELRASPVMKNGPESAISSAENVPMSPTTSSKAKLISRMAKMGQPILPMSGATIATDNSTDSEADEASASSDTGGPPTPSSLPPMRKPAKAPRKHLQNPAPPSQLPPHQPHQPQMSPSQHHQLAIYQSQPQYPDQMHQQQPLMGVNQPPMQFQQQQPVQSNVMFGQTHQPQMTSMGQQIAAPMGQPLTAPVGFQTQMAPATSIYPGTLMQTTTSDVQSSLVLSEARQHHSDLRQAVIQVSERISNINQKMDTLQANQMQANSGSTVPNMEANILMQNIQRIMQENARLKTDVYEKSSKIETQNDKISELLQRNQMFVEESNSLLEKRNDTYKQTATQSQLRVLELEQEKVKLTTDLSNATARLSSLQLELGQVQQREAGLKNKLSTSVSSVEDQQGEVDLLKVQCRDSEKKLENLSRILKDDKLVKKQLESKLNNLEEEMADVKAEKEAVDKNLLDRRKKAAAERQRSQDEMEEMKRSYEEELSSLKSRLRQQKSSTDAATAEQVSQIESELEVQFKERSERIINQAKDTYQRELSDIREEKDQLVRKLASTEQKMLTLRSSQGDSKEQVDQLKEKLEENQVWKEKYESLHSNALSMKEKYEKRIKELIQEKSAPASPPASPANVVDEVKKVMNNVYHSLKSEFESGQNYKGTEVMATIMNTIKVTTIRMVQQQQSSQEDEAETDESQDEEDEEQEDEDTEEEQISVQVEEPVQASAPSLVSASPAQHKDNIPDLPEVDQSSQEGESQQGEVAEDDTDEEEEEEKAEGDGDWEKEEQESSGGIHNEKPESDVNTNNEGVEAASSLSSDQLVYVPDIPDLEQSSETVEADSQPFGEDKESEEEEVINEEVQPVEEADPQMFSEDPKTEDTQGVDDSQSEAEKGEADLFPSGEDSKTEDSQSMEYAADLQTSSEKPESVKEEEEREEESKEEDEKAEVEQPEVEQAEVEQPEEEQPEVEQAEGTPVSADPLAVPIMTREPPDMPPELPPDLPPNDEDEEPEEDRKVEQRGLFGDDSDSDGDFFDAIPPSRKSTEKKETPPPQEEDEESLKPKPPPPLFGDSDDDDDLDWMN